MTTAAYDYIADWYDKSIRQGSLLHELTAETLFDLAGDIAGTSICDLACGQGELARQMARRGAHVTGVDISSNLVAIAQHEEDIEALGITYLVDDAQTLRSVKNAVFNGVVCNMALMDIPDHVAVLDTVRRVLQPGGWLYISITHPCFQIPPQGDYFDEVFWWSDNLHGVRGQVGARHRTLASYLNAIADAGLLLTRIAEPKLAGRDVPVVLAALCRLG